MKNPNLKDSKKDKGRSYTVKAVKHVSSGLTISVCCSPNCKFQKNEYFCYRDEDYIGAFVKE